MKKLVALLTAASMCLAPVSAFAADISPEELIQRSQEASKGNTSISMTMPINVDLGLKLSIPIDAGDGTTSNMDFEIPIKMSGQYEFAAISETMQLSLVGDFKMASISMMGQEIMPETAMTMETYVIASEDGSKYDTYTKTDDGQNTPEWTHQVTDVSEMASVFNAKDLAEMNAMSFEELFPGVELNYEVTESDTAYNVGMKLSAEDLMPILQKSIEAESDQLPDGYDEMLDYVMGMLGGLTMNYEVGINKNTYLMETIHVDLNDSDLSGLNEFVSSMMAGSDQDMDMEIIVNDFSIDGTCRYNDVTEIVVPAEALTTSAISSGIVPSIETADYTSEEMTMGQKNALQAANSYLEYSAFSYQGLIEQLEYEKYTHEDAVFAADNCGADWSEQAVKSAANYLEYSAFSRDGLIDQLEYDGYTHDQAVYGVEQNGY